MLREQYWRPGWVLGSTGRQGAPCGAGEDSRAQKPILCMCLPSSRYRLLVGRVAVHIKRKGALLSLTGSLLHTSRAKDVELCRRNAGLNHGAAEI